MLAGPTLGMKTAAAAPRLTEVMPSQCMASEAASCCEVHCQQPPLKLCDMVCEHYSGYQGTILCNVTCIISYTVKVSTPM